MAVIPAGYAQANFMFSGEALPNGAEVTMGLELGIAEPTPAEVALACQTAWADNLLPFQSSSSTFDGVMVKFGPQATGPSAEFLVGLEGGSPADSEAPAVAVLVRKNTSDGGRAGKGRMYLPAFNEEQIETGGFVNGTIAIDLNLALETFRTDLFAEGLTLVVLHGPESPLSAPSTITSMLTRPAVATQMRRNRRRR